MTSIDLHLTFCFQAGMPKLGAKKRLAKQLLYDMNVAQLQVVVNDLHTQIESEWKWRPSLVP